MRFLLYRKRVDYIYIRIDSDSKELDEIKKATEDLTDIELEVEYIFKRLR